MSLTSLSNTILCHCERGLSIKLLLLHQSLLEAGADINILDDDKNSVLHVKCYGENNESSQLQCISRLVSLIRCLFEIQISIHC